MFPADTCLYNATASESPACANLANSAETAWLPPDVYALYNFLCVFVIPRALSACLFFCANSLALLSPAFFKLLLYVSILESTVFNPFTKLSIPDFILVDAEDNCFKSLDEVDTLLSDDCIVFNALNTSLEPLVKLDDFEFN